MKKIGMKAKKTADAFLTYAILLIVSIIFVFPCFFGAPFACPARRDRQMGGIFTGAK